MKLEVPHRPEGGLLYQTMSPESMPTSTIRKSNSHIRSSSNKDDQNIALENGRVNITSGASVNSTVTSLQQKQQYQTEHINQPHVSETSLGRTQSLGGTSGGGGGGGNGDVLLQWGQRKRSRCSRTEGRSMLEKSQMTNHIMPPVHPSSLASTSSNSNNNGCKNGVGRVRPNGLLSAKNGSGFPPSKNRNLGDQMGCSSSASPLRNGGGGSGTRAISRSSVGKRSPSRIDKSDKKISGSGSIRKVKSDDPLPVHHTESSHGERENGGVNATMACSPVEADKGCNNEVIEWPRIYLSLSRKEKEEDFYAMKGTKLPHRPKKRAKAVDRALQYCFPGLWLSDLTRARYEVRERKSTKKPKRRGLKGLENMESESE